MPVIEPSSATRLAKRLGAAAIAAIAAAAATAAGQPLMQSLSGTGGSAPREGAGRILWQFEMADMTRQFVKVGPDGVIYAGDRLGLYALSPDGELLWFHEGAGGLYPIDIGPDGTIYAGPVMDAPETLLIRAINPDGTTKWEFHDSVRTSLIVGPSVGPDGAIYGMTDTLLSPLGVFSLDAEGELRWSNPGEPPTRASGGPPRSSSEFVFAADRLYVAHDPHGGGLPATFSFRLDNGEQLWYTAAGGLDNDFLSFPNVDPMGRAIGTWGQTGLIALEPDGDTAWFTIHPDQSAQGGYRPAVDSRGIIYQGASNGRMWAVNPGGDIRWVRPEDPVTSHSRLGVSPDDATIVAHFFSDAEGTFITGHDTADGAELWRIPLRGGRDHVTTLYPVFSRDARTAYLTSSPVGLSILYAIDISSGDCYADCDASGGLDFFDFLCFQNGFAAADPLADCDGSGELDFFDFLCFQNAFAEGCP